jgi:hypothetical protein
MSILNTLQDVLTMMIKAGDVNHLTLPVGGHGGQGHRIAPGVTAE